jgi:hypothetical protein
MPATSSLVPTITRDPHLDGICIVFDASGVRVAGTAMDDRQLAHHVVPALDLRWPSSPERVVTGDKPLNCEHDPCEGAPAVVAATGMRGGG